MYHVTPYEFLRYGMEVQPLQSKVSDIMGSSGISTDMFSSQRNIAVAIADTYRPMLVSVSKTPSSVLSMMFDQEGIPDMNSQMRPPSAS